MLESFSRGYIFFFFKSTVNTLCIIPSKLLNTKKFKLPAFAHFSNTPQDKMSGFPPSKHHLQTLNSLPAFPRLSPSHGCGILKRLCLRGSYCFDRAMTKSNIGRKGFLSHFHITFHHLKEGRPETQRREWSKGHRGILFTSLLCLLFHTIQAHQPRDSTVRGEVAPERTRVRAHTHTHKHKFKKPSFLVSLVN